MKNNDSQLEKLAELKRRASSLVRGIKHRVRHVLGYRDNVFWEIKNTKTGEVRSGSFHNGITTAGKRKLLNVASPGQLSDFVYIAIGTSSTAFNASQTALGTEVARSGAKTPTNPDSDTFQVQHTFPAGTGTGAIVEAGLLNASSSGTLLNRSVFSAINKGADDELTMTIKIT